MSKFKVSTAQNIANLSPLFILAYGILYIYFGEPFYLDGGLQYDALIYATYARDLFGTLKHVGVDDYHATRLLPSVIIFLGSRLIDYNLDSPARIFNAFSLYNAILLSATAWLWLRISKLSRFSWPVFWLGFFSLFINFCNFKSAQYDPVQTDITAFFFGMLFVYLYLNDRPFLLCLSAIVASFAWEIAIYFAFLCMLNVKLVTVYRSLILERYLSITLLILFLLIVVIFNLIDPHLMINGADQVNKIFLLASMAIAGSYIWFVTKFSEISKKIPKIRDFLFKVDCRRMLYILLAAFFYFGFLHLIREYYGLSTALGFGMLLPSLFTTSVAKPAIFIIAHTMFYGPIIILFAFYVKSTFKMALESGYGIYLYLITTLVLALNSETRMLMLSLPLFVYLVCKAVSTTFLPWRFVMIYGILSLLLSKFYLPITPSMKKPWIHVFNMNNGPWMHWDGYFINLILFSLTFLIMYLSLRKSMASYVSPANQLPKIWG